MKIKYNYKEFGCSGILRELDLKSDAKLTQLEKA